MPACHCVHLKLKSAERCHSLWLPMLRLRIPRRPPWTPEQSAEAVDAQERAAFLAWRRGLAAVEEQEHLVLTPFEKNLEVWRQLWRVLERSHIVVQARLTLAPRLPPTLPDLAPGVLGALGAPPDHKRASSVGNACWVEQPAARAAGMLCALNSSISSATFSQTARCAQHAPSAFVNLRAPFQTDFEQSPEICLF